MYQKCFWCITSNASSVQVFPLDTKEDVHFTASWQAVSSESTIVGRHRSHSFENRIMLNLGNITKCYLDFSFSCKFKSMPQPPYCKFKFLLKLIYIFIFCESNKFFIPGGRRELNPRSVLQFPKIWEIVHFCWITTTFNSISPLHKVDAQFYCLWLVNCLIYIYIKSQYNGGEK